MSWQWISWVLWTGGWGRGGPGIVLEHPIKAVMEFDVTHIPRP